MFEILKPISHKTICQIEYEVMTFGIEIRYLTVQSEIDDVPESNRKLTIPHAPLNIWLKDQGYLDWETNTSDHTGRHIQQTGEIGYIDFIQDLITDQILYDYMKAANMVTHAYDPTLA